MKIQGKYKEVEMSEKDALALFIDSSSMCDDGKTKIGGVIMDIINNIEPTDELLARVGDDKTGVVGVTVYTEHKVYHYIIHAHYRVENIPESKRIEKDMFGDDVERYDTRQVYESYVEPNGQWNWRYQL